MKFQYTCKKCNYTNRWPIDESGRISEFVCKCGKHIGYSDATVIKFYEKIDIKKEEQEGRLKLIFEEVLRSHLASTTFTVSDIVTSAATGVTSDWHHYSDSSTTW